MEPGGSLSRSLPHLSSREGAALDALQAQWASDGLDVVAALRAEWYHAEVGPAYHLPSLGLAGRELTVVLGNSRALWPPFVAALREDPARIEASDPLDDYVSERTELALEAHLGELGWRWQIRWAWEEPPRRVAMQRLASAARLAWLAPCHLSIHPRLGPWFALRAAIVFDRPGPSALPALPPTCDACVEGCQPALGAALARPLDWRAWLALREACPKGRDARYDDDQIAYHYTKDSEILRGLLGDG